MNLVIKGQQDQVALARTSALVFVRGPLLLSVLQHILDLATFRDLTQVCEDLGCRFYSRASRDWRCTQEIVLS